MSRLEYIVDIKGNTADLESKLKAADGQLEKLKKNTVKVNFETSKDLKGQIKSELAKIGKITPELETQFSFEDATRDFEKLRKEYSKTLGGLDPLEPINEKNIEKAARRSLQTLRKYSKQAEEIADKLVDSEAQLDNAKIARESNIKRGKSTSEIDNRIKALNKQRQSILNEQNSIAQRGRNEAEIASNLFKTASSKLKDTSNLKKNPIFTELGRLVNDFYENGVGEFLKGSTSAVKSHKDVLANYDKELRGKYGVVEQLGETVELEVDFNSKSIDEFVSKVSNAKQEMRGLVEAFGSFDQDLFSNTTDSAQKLDILANKLKEIYKIRSDKKLNDSDFISQYGLESVATMDLINKYSDGKALNEVLGVGKGANIARFFGNTKRFQQSQSVLDEWNSLGLSAENIFGVKDKYGDSVDAQQLAKKVAIEQFNKQNRKMLDIFRKGELNGEYSKALQDVISGEKSQDQIVNAVKGKRSELLANALDSNFDIKNANVFDDKIKQQLLEVRTQMLSELESTDNFSSIEDAVKSYKERIDSVFDSFYSTEADSQSFNADGLLQTLEQFNTYLEQIANATKQLSQSFDEIFSSVGENGSAKNFSAYLKEFADSFDVLSNINLDFSSFKKTPFDQLKNLRLEYEELRELFDDSKFINSVHKNQSDFVKFYDAAENVGKSSTEQQMKGYDALIEVYKKYADVNGVDISGVVSKFEGQKDLPQTISNMSSIFDTLSANVETLNGLNLDGIVNNLQRIAQVFPELGSDFDATKLVQQFNDFASSINSVFSKFENNEPIEITLKPINIDAIVGELKAKLNPIDISFDYNGASLSNNGGNKSYDNALRRINSIQNKMSAYDGVDTANLSNLRTKMSALDVLRTDINTLRNAPSVDVDELNTKLTTFKNTLKEVTTLYNQISKKDSNESIGAKLLGNDKLFNKIESTGNSNYIKQIRDRYNTAISNSNYTQAKSVIDGANADVASSTQHNNQVANSYRELINAVTEYMSLTQRIDSSDTTSKEAMRVQEIQQAWKEASQGIGKYSISQYGSMSSQLNAQNAMDNVFNVDSGYLGKQYQKMQAKMNAVINSDKYTSSMRNSMQNVRNNMQQLFTPDGISGDDFLKKYTSYVADFDNLSSKLSSNASKNANKQASDLTNNISRYMNQYQGMGSDMRSQFEALANSIRAVDDPSMELVNNWRASFNSLQEDVHGAGLETQSVFQMFTSSIARQSANAIATYFSFYDIIRYAKETFNTVKDLDSAMTELNKVSDVSEKRLSLSFENSSKTAKEMGSTITDVINSTADWSRLGYSIDQSEQLAKITALYQNVGDNIDQQTASQSLVSTLQGFQLDTNQAESVIDKFNEVANNYAIDSAGIGTALQKSAASFNEANTDLSGAIALIAGTNEVIQEPDTVGNMWKTVAMRIRGATTELEAMGEDTEGVVESSSKLRDLILGMTGFDIMESNGKDFKSMYDIIVGIGEEYGKLDDIDQAALLEKLAGKNRSNALAAAFGNIDTIKEAYETAENSAGSASREQEKYAESIQYSVDRAKASLQELASDFLSSDFAKGAIDSATAFINLLDTIVSKVGSLNIAIGAFASLSFFKQSKITDAQKKAKGQNLTGVSSSTGASSSATASAMANAKEASAINSVASAYNAKSKAASKSVASEARATTASEKSAIAHEKEASKTGLVEQAHAKYENELLLSQYKNNTTPIEYVGKSRTRVPDIYGLQNNAVYVPKREQQSNVLDVSSGTDVTTLLQQQNAELRKTVAINKQAYNLYDKMAGVAPVQMPNQTPQAYTPPKLQGQTFTGFTTELPKVTPKITPPELEFDLDNLPKLEIKQSNFSKISSSLSNSVSDVFGKVNTALTSVGSKVQSVATNFASSMVDWIKSPAGIITGAMLAFQGISYVADALYETFDEAYESAKDARSKYEQARDEANSIKTQMDANTSRIEELQDVENKSLSQELELGKLREQNAKLQADYQTKEAVAQTRQQFASEQASKALTKTKYVSEVEEGTSTGYGRNTVANTKPKAVNILEETLGYIEKLDENQAKLDSLNRQQAKLEASGKEKSKEYKQNTSDIKFYENATEDLSNTITENLGTIDELYASLFDEDGRIITGNENLVAQIDELTKSYRQKGMTALEKNLDAINTYFNGSRSRNRLRDKLVQASRDGKDLDAVLKGLGLSMEDLGFNVSEIDDGSAINALKRYFDELSSSVEKASGEIAKFDGSINSVEKATESKNYSDQYDTIAGYVKTAEKLYKAGKTGTDDFQSIVEYLSPGVTYKYNPKAKDNHFESLDYTYEYEKLKPVLDKYFIADNPNTDTNESLVAVNNALTTLEKAGLAKKVSKNVTRPDGSATTEVGYDWDLKKFKSSADAAKAFGVSLNAAEDILHNLEDYSAEFSDVMFSGEMLNRMKDGIDNLDIYSDQLKKITGDKGYLDKLKEKYDEFATAVDNEEYEALDKLTEDQVIHVEFLVDQAALQEEIDMLKERARLSGDAKDYVDYSLANEEFISNAKKNAGIGRDGLDNTSVKLGTFENKINEYDRQLAKSGLSDSARADILKQRTSMQEAEKTWMNAFSQANPNINADSDIADINKAWKDFSSKKQKFQIDTADLESVQALMSNAQIGSTVKFNADLDGIDTAIEGFKRNANGDMLFTIDAVINNQEQVESFFNQYWQEGQSTELRFNANVDGVESQISAIKDADGSISYKQVNDSGIASKLLELKHQEDGSIAFESVDTSAVDKAISDVEDKPITTQLDTKVNMDGRIEDTIEVSVKGNTSPLESSIKNVANANKEINVDVKAKTETAVAKVKSAFKGFSADVDVNYNGDTSQVQGEINKVTSTPHTVQFTSTYTDTGGVGAAIAQAKSGVSSTVQGTVNYSVGKVASVGKQIANGVVNYTTGTVQEAKIPNKTAQVTYKVNASAVNAYKPPAKTSTVTYRVSAPSYTPPNKSATVTYNVRVVGLNQIKNLDRTVTYTTIHKANGTAHADGTVSSYPSYYKGGNSSFGSQLHHAYASGNWGLQEDEKDVLINELGAELVVNPNTSSWEILNNGYPTFADLPKGSIVFNHLQTEQLLRNGYVTNSHGRAHANGTVGGMALANGIRLTGGAKNYVATGGKSGSSGNSYSPSQAKSSASANEFKETIDWIEIHLDRLETKIDDFENVADSAFEVLATRMQAYKNAIADVRVEITKQQQAVEEYTKKANSIGLAESYAQLVRDGTIRLDTITDEGLKKKIDEYKEWYEKAIDSHERFLELYEELKEYYKDMFTLVIEHYEDELDLLEKRNDLVESYIDLAKAEGKYAGEAYYNDFIDKASKRLSILEKEREDAWVRLTEAVKNGTEVGSEAYYDMLSQYEEILQDVVDARTKIQELQNDLRDTQWEFFDDFIDKLDDVVDELEFFDEIMSSKKLFDDDTGERNEFGNAILGTRVMRYDVYMKQAKYYADEIAKIESDMAKDPNNQDLIERRYELLEAQRDAISNAYKEKDSIKDLINDGYDSQLDALQKLIDKKKELLEINNEEYEYARDIAKQQKEINKLQKQLNAYGTDDSEEASAKRQKLRDELNDKREELQDKIEEKRISDTEKLLDNIYDEFEELLNNRLDDIDALIAEQIEAVNANGSEIANTIRDVASDIGYNIDTPLSSALESTDNLVSDFHKTFIDANASILQSIENIERITQQQYDRDNKDAEELLKELASQENKNETSLKSAEQVGKFNKYGNYSYIYDYDYYRSHNKDLEALYGDDEDKYFEHFVNNGIKEGRRGNEFFDVNAYKNAKGNEDLVKAYGNDLAKYYQHYLNYGINENRTARIADSEFNADIYKSNYDDLSSMSNSDLLKHYLTYGKNEGRTANEILNQEKYDELVAQRKQEESFNNKLKKYGDYIYVYDYDYYKSHNKDLQNAYGDDEDKYFEHFLKWGMKEGRQANSIFDVKYYKANNDDLQKAYGSDYVKYYEHFMKYGAKEGRATSTDFNPKTSPLVNEFDDDYLALIKQYLKTSKAYASGAKSVRGNQYAITNEEGMELILQDGSVLSPIKNGARIFSALATDNLWNFANNPSSFLGDLKVPQSSSVVSNNNEFSININVPNASDYKSFVRELQSDRQFEKLIQEMTFGTMRGNNSFAKFNINI